MFASDRTLVIIGNDPALDIDLSAFRGVREDTGMKFTRLRNPTLKQLENYLRILRLEMKGKLPNIHFAAHMGVQGAHIQDALLTPEKISELFSGSPIMFLAGCESLDIGSALRSVPFVVSMLEKIGHEDATAASLVWWTALGHGYSEEEAFEQMAEIIPNVGEFAHLHKNRFLAPKGS